MYHPMLPGVLSDVVAIRRGHLGFRGPRSCCANAPGPWGRKGVETKKKLKLTATETRRNGRRVTQSGHPKGGWFTNNCGIFNHLDHIIVTMTMTITMTMSIITIIIILTLTSIAMITMIALLIIVLLLIVITTMIVTILILTGIRRIWNINTTN